MHIIGEGVMICYRRNAAYSEIKLSTNVNVASVWDIMRPDAGSDYASYMSMVANRLERPSRNAFIGNSLTSRDIVKLLRKKR